MQVAIMGWKSSRLADSFFNVGLKRPIRVRVLDDLPRKRDRIETLHQEQRAMSIE
jgi:hypothetical protein